MYSHLARLPCAVPEPLVCAHISLHCTTPEHISVMHTAQYNGSGLGMVQHTVPVPGSGAERLVETAGLDVPLPGNLGQR